MSNYTTEEEITVSAEIDLEITVQTVMDSVSPHKLTLSPSKTIWWTRSERRLKMN